MFNEKTIYIGMPSYNEPYLEMTIKECFEKAEFPDRIHMGVWSHNSDGKDAHFLKEYKNVNYAQLYYPIGFGTGSARLNALNFYNEEDFYLQIDPHMIFAENWDTRLIELFYELKEKYEKPVISTFVPYWYMSKGEIKYGGGDECTKIYWMTDILKTQCPTFGGGPKTWEDGETYQEHYLTSGHFMFTEKEFLNDFLPDVNILFEGEEPCLSIRAWTRGYRFFTPREILMWHFDRYHEDSDDLYEFDRVKGPQAWVPQWMIDHDDYRYDKAMKRVRKILTGEYIGHWGAPSRELLSKYETEAGVDFKKFYQERDEFLKNNTLS
jgi:hypothetical protein